MTPRDQTSGTAVDVEPVVEATSLSKNFGHIQALDGVDVSLFPGEVVALVGDNGAGKSTFVSILAGRFQPDEGHVTVRGKKVKIDSPLRAGHLGIATVFQHLALVDQRDIAANLFLGNEPKRFHFIADRSQMESRSVEVLNRLRIRLPSVRVQVAALSGGQRQAVAVARAMLRDAGVFLLDEPTAALGVREARQVLDLIITLRNEGRAVLLVSHNLENVFDVADRVIVFRLGRKVANVPVTTTTRDEIVAFITGARAPGGEVE